MLRLVATHAVGAMGLVHRISENHVVKKSKSKPYTIKDNLCEYLTGHLDELKLSGVQGDGYIHVLGHATAGARSEITGEISKEAKDKLPILMETVNDCLTAYNATRGTNLILDKKDFTVLSPSEEALYALRMVQNLAGGKKNVASMEMGGKSLQIAALKFDQVQFDSLLSDYGNDALQRQLKQIPQGAFCYTNDNKNDHEDKAWDKGTLDWQGCLGAIKSLKIRTPIAPFRKDMDYYVFGSLFHSMKALNLHSDKKVKSNNGVESNIEVGLNNEYRKNPTMLLAQIKAKAERYCISGHIRNLQAKRFITAIHEFHKQLKSPTEEQRTFPGLCLQAAWFVTLLQKMIKAPGANISGTKLIVSNKLKEQSLSWTWGRALEKLKELKELESEDNNVVVLDIGSSSTKVFHYARNDEFGQEGALSLTSKTSGQPKKITHIGGWYSLAAE